MLLGRRPAGAGWSRVWSRQEQAGAGSGALAGRVLQREVELSRTLAHSAFIDFLLIPSEFFKLA